MRARIGIDLGGTKIEGIRLEADGEISRRFRSDTPRDDYQATIKALVELVGRLDDGSARIGVGSPGSWIASLARMQNCNSTWLNGRPLLDDLNRALFGRVRLANDADCFALSETRGGSADGRNVVFGAILGTGVGGGLVVGGKLLQGPNGLAGEWGHTPLAHPAAGMPSRQCYCGRTDCVETWLSGPGLLASHRVLWPEEARAPEDGHEVYARTVTVGAESEEVSRARDTLALYCRLLAENLARVVNTVDPDAIVLGGGLSQMQEMYPVVRELMSEHVFGEVFDTRLLSPAFGASSGVRGAAWLWAADE